ncbi:hypothetical protein D3C79_1008460 [compost metagenome]
MGKLFRQLDKIEAAGLENYVIPLAIRLQFEFAARRSETVTLEWEWVDLEHRRCGRTSRFSSTGELHDDDAQAAAGDRGFTRRT